MFIYLSKLLPLFVYPLGLACFVLITALLVRRHPQWQTRLIAIALAVLWLGGNHLVMLTVVRSLEWRYAPPPATYTDVPHADAIVVLGGGARSAQYPRPITEVNEAGDRLLYAAWLYHHGAASQILVSGGAVPWVGPERPSGAESMVNILKLLDIPEEAVLVESNSRNTHENAVESFKILQAQGLDNIVLVTSAMHMPRAYAVFAQSDLTVIPAPTDYSFTQADWTFFMHPQPTTLPLDLVPTADDLAVTTRALKEYIGIIVYRLRGWL